MMKRKKKIEEMGTNLKGRLKNTMLPKNKAIFHYLKLLLIQFILLMSE